MHPLFFYRPIFFNQIEKSIGEDAGRNFKGPFFLMVLFFSHNCRKFPLYNQIPDADIFYVFLNGLN